MQLIRLVRPSAGTSPESSHPEMGIDPAVHTEPPAFTDTRHGTLYKKGQTSGKGKRRDATVRSQLSTVRSSARTRARAAWPVPINTPWCRRKQPELWNSGELLGSVRAVFSQPLVVFVVVVVVVFLSSLLWLIVYVALHEVAWCMAAWCTLDALRRQQFHVTPAMSALRGVNISIYLRMYIYIYKLAIKS